MATARDIQLRQLMLHEHRTGNDEKTACKKICEKLGPNSITISKVKYWYKRFQSGDTSIFNKSSYFHRLKNASQQKKGENVLMQFKDKRLGGLVTKLDGRNFIFSKGYATNAKEQFILVDLFHGAVRQGLGFGYFWLLWLKFCDWIVILIWKIFNSNLFLSV
jgi:hypothetical protein